MPIMSFSTDENDDFMDGPLIIWLKSCLEDPGVLNDYNDVVDGVLLYQVLLQIDPEPAFCGVVPPQGNAQLRVRNLDIILKNLRNLYHDEFGQLVIMVPNVVRLGTEGSTPAAKHDLTLMLLLLLACAVQCPNKEQFIEKIKLLPIDVQHSIVDYIKQFTDTPLMVLGVDQEAELNRDVLLKHLRHLVAERDDFLASWANVAAGESPPSLDKTRTSSMSSSSESHHLAVELADWKSKLRKQRQELEEKTEALNEAKDELEEQRSLVARLRQENADVLQDARSAKAYRDELDAIKEKAERAEKLEAELERHKAKLRDVDFYKTRVEELREDNRVLIETREMLEEQLKRARKRGDRVPDLEAENLKLKQRNNELALEGEAKDRKVEELYAEIAEVQVLARSALQGDTSLKAEFDAEPSETGENSLSSQLTSNATAQILRLELENHRLRSNIESLKESAFPEVSTKLLESERENKRLSLHIEQMEEQCKRITAENKELETLVKDALQESRKLQESRESLRTTVDGQQLELQDKRDQLEAVKRELEYAVEEKLRLLPRLEELERNKGAVEEWQRLAAQVPDLSGQLCAAQKDVEAAEARSGALQKDVLRLKEEIETKNRKVDELFGKAEAASKEREQLTEELKSARAVAVKLHEVEREKDELSSRIAVSQEALTALQTELVQHKVDYQQLRSSLDRLGLSVDLVLDPSVTLANLMSKPEFKAQLPEELRAECQKCRELAGLQEDSARLEVLVTTLQCTINTLSAQQTAVQLANTQLAAEKEQLEEERKAEREAYDQLLADQTSLRELHEQLTSEHEAILKKQDTLRQTLREKQKENLTLREACGRQKAAEEAAKSDREALAEKTLSIKNLREEHSKLKEDFRELFALREKMKEDYMAMKGEYTKVRTENSQRQLRNAQLEEEVTQLSDTVRHNELQLAKLAETNAMLEEDRRSVMDHATTLLAQYQELFTHSLEDNQHYHAVEKQFVDKLNEFRRQKEKLEEKIMDQYRKLDSTSNKKKGIGAILARKVRKAGSLINRSRRSLHEDSRASLNIHGSESGENESDGSLEDTRNEGDGPLPHILKQQVAGTRQTVYEADSLPPRTDESGQSTFMVYNRMRTTTTVVGVEPSPPSPSLSLRSQSEEAKRKAKKSNIYFDYGCV